MKPYYEHAGITIYHGDCREILPGVRADVVVTDPPYGVSLGDHKAASDGRDYLLRKGHYASYEDSQENFVSVVEPGVVQALVRCQWRGAVFTSAFGASVLPQARAIGGIYMPGGVGRNSWGFTNFSPVLMYGLSPHTTDGCRATVFENHDAAEVNGHPCPKPYRWMVWLVGLASKPGETVLDPFMGSGTTLVAAKNLGRKAIGIEIEERYCEIAARRLAQEVMDLK